MVEAIKAINYIRTQVKSGATTISISSRSIFGDECYLKPVLEDDALLYSLGDIVKEIDHRDGSNAHGNGVYSQDNKSPTSLIYELRDELQRLQQEFVAYRNDVAKVLDKKWNDSQAGSPTPEEVTRQNDAPPIPPKDNDSHYFTSYSYNG